VMVVLPDATVAQRQIETDEAIGDRWLVNSGLQPGERVVVTGLQRVQPGMRVSATEMGASAVTSAGATPAPTD